MQHPPISVPLGLQEIYKPALQRLLKEGIITEMHEHTEWLNLTVIVVKEDGSLKLCLDPKHLNKATEYNHWYSGTLDDILPKFLNSKYFSVNYAKSGFWHVVLDLRKSLLITFNTPWGKLWLRLLFRLKVDGDVFQVRLDKVLRILDRIHGITDDIQLHMGYKK